MKNFINKLNSILILFIPKIIFADDGKGFFSDFKGVRTGSKFISARVTENLANVFGFGYDILKWIWIFLVSFTVICVIISLVRLAILADDVPYKKAEAKHDLAASLVILAIIGSTPFLFNVILILLNMFQ